MLIIRPNIVRPIVLLLIFFGTLFVFRDPLRNFDENTAILKQTYIDPLISNPNIPIATSTATSSVQGGTSTIKPATPVSSAPNKSVLISKDQTIKADDSPLSIAGILQKTNNERIKKNLPSLRLNLNLNGSAVKKLDDMFTNQYFEHQSPTGLNVSDLVVKQDYQYIVVGENLALGNFGGDAQVVTAWMNSPGHRANILDARFQEIGIAVGRGIYKGREQWLAVQHFAKPLSSCTSPNSVLKTGIDNHTRDLAGSEQELSILKNEIDSSSDNYSDAYRAKVERYNNLVVEYNNRLESLKDEISRYNEQVRGFNSCAGLVTTTKKITGQQSQLDS